MKLAIISDTHFGVRNDSPFFLEESLAYFENQFLPYLKSNHINTILHLGDLMDRRKYVNFNTLSQVRTRFFEPLRKRNIKLECTLGNHDTYFRNTNKINSIEELFYEYENVEIHTEPTEISFGKLKLGIVPWITNDNEQICLDFIQNTSASILAGHFEINGFEVVSGIYHSHGVEANIFSKFDKVLSGHFHIRQTKGNIHYLGTQYQMNFGDIYGKKGFSVLDTDTRELEFIENNRKVFNVIKYDDVNGFEKINQDEIRNTFIKVLVINKKKPKLFDSFVDILGSCDLQELTIIEEMEKSEEDSDEIDMAQDTLSIIANEIDSMDNVPDKQKMKNILREIYLESMSQ